MAIPIAPDGEIPTTTPTAASSAGDPEPPCSLSSSRPQQMLWCSKPPRDRAAGPGTRTVRPPSAAGFALAQGVDGGVGPAGRSGSGKRLAAEEEAGEDDHRVAQVDCAVIAGVRGIEAGGLRP